MPTWWVDLGEKDVAVVGEDPDQALARLGRPSLERPLLLDRHLACRKCEQKERCLGSFWEEGRVGQARSKETSRAHVCVTCLRPGLGLEPQRETVGLSALCPRMVSRSDVECYECQARRASLWGQYPLPQRKREALARLHTIESEIAQWEREHPDNVVSLSHFRKLEQARQEVSASDDPRVLLREWAKDPRVRELIQQVQQLIRALLDGAPSSIKRALQRLDPPVLRGIVRPWWALMVLIMKEHPEATDVLDVWLLVWTGEPLVRERWAELPPPVRHRYRAKWLRIIARSLPH